MEITNYSGHDGKEYYKISDENVNITTDDDGNVDFGLWPLDVNSKYELKETLSLIIRAVVSLKNEKKL